MSKSKNKKHKKANETPTQRNHAADDYVVQVDGKDERVSLVHEDCPLDAEELLLLANYLDNMLQVGCRHSLFFTEMWLDHNGLPFERFARWLRKHGIRCDCGILSNALLEFVPVSES